LFGIIIRYEGVFVKSRLTVKAIRPIAVV